MKALNTFLKNFFITPLQKYPSFKSISTSTVKQNYSNSSSQSLQIYQRLKKIEIKEIVLKAETHRLRQLTSEQKA